MESTTQVETSEVKDPKVIPALKSAASKTGSGLHIVGSKVADANLRSLGKGLKTLGRKVPVRIERTSSTS